MQKERLKLPQKSLILENWAIWEAPEDPLGTETEPRFQCFPRGPVGPEPAVPVISSRTRWTRTRGSAVRGETRSTRWNRLLYCFIGEFEEVCVAGKFA